MSELSARAQVGSGRFFAQDVVKLTALMAMVSGGPACQAYSCFFCTFGGLIGGASGDLGGFPGGMMVMA